MAIHFDAAVGDLNGDLLRRTTELLSDNSAYTVMFWVKLSLDTNRINVFWYFTNNGYPCEFIATTSDGTTLQITSLRDGSTGMTTFGSSLTPGVWYHVALVRTSISAALQVYLNGVLNITGTAINMTGRAGVSKIDWGGGNPDGTSPLDGDFAYGRAWQRALSGAEIIAEMKSPSAVSLASIYGDWPTLGGSGVWSQDVSGQGHHWSIRGSIDSNRPEPPLPQTISPALLDALSTLYNPHLIRTGLEVISADFLDESPVLYEPALIRHYLRINVGKDAQGASYEYRGLRATDVELTYSPRQTYSGLLWQTKSEDPIKVDALSTRDVIVSPETDEGFKIIANLVNGYGIGGSTFTALDDTSTNRTALIAATITQEGQRIRLTFENTHTDKVSITAALYGTGYYTKDKQTLVLSDRDLRIENGGYRAPLKINLQLVADELEAESLAIHLLDVLKNQKDGIFSMSYQFGSGLQDEDRLNTILGIKVGDVIEVSEEQSGVEYAPHIVLAEKFQWAGSSLKIDHTLLPVKVVIPE